MNSGRREPFLLLGIGNSLRRDDGLGPAAARLARRSFRERAVPAEVLEAQGFGFDELDAITCRRGLIVVDAAETGAVQPGTLCVLHGEEAWRCMPCRAGSSHSADLQSLFDLGRSLGMELPERVALVTVEAAETAVFSEELSERVEASLAATVAAIEAIVRDWERSP